MWDLLILALCVYVIAALVVEGHIIEGPRGWVIMKTPWLRFTYHLLECRFCVGFWVALLGSLAMGDIGLAIPAWGAAHFMRKLERPPPLA